MSGESPQIIGRYALHDRIASGGMASVHIGRLVGPIGFARTVAIKRLHPQFASNPEFVTMFLDEARLAARIQHPNVVPTLDVVTTKDELFLVMEYVRGESVSALLRNVNQSGERIPLRIAAAITSGALQGLHAAHTATDEEGHPLGIVHRDVSPQNILVGVDGTPRVLDFGVAKAANRLHTTRGNEIKGKLLYMSPEQLEGDSVDCTADVYAMGLILFELLTGRRMFQKSDDSTAVAKIIRNELTLPSTVHPRLAPWDSIVRQAAAKDPAARFPTARAMALAVERVVGIASPVEVADFVDQRAGTTIKERSKLIGEIESAKSPAVVESQRALVNDLASSNRSSAERNSVPPKSPDIAGEGSAASKVSHALSLPTPAPPWRWRSTAIAAALLSVLALPAVIFGAKRLRTAAGDPPPAANATSASGAESLHAPATATASPPPPTPAAPATSASTVETEVQPLAPPTGSAAAQAAPAPTASAPQKPAVQTAQPKPAAKPKCDRPYTVDSTGHMHFRAECL